MTKEPLALPTLYTEQVRERFPRVYHSLPLTTGTSQELIFVDFRPMTSLAMHCGILVLSVEDQGWKVALLWDAGRVGDAGCILTQIAAMDTKGEDFRSLRAFSAAINVSANEIYTVLIRVLNPSE